MWYISDVSGEKESTKKYQQIIQCVPIISDAKNVWYHSIMPLAQAHELIVSLSRDNKARFVEITG